MCGGAYLGIMYMRGGTCVEGQQGKAQLGHTAVHLATNLVQWFAQHAYVTGHCQYAGLVSAQFICWLPL